MAHTPVLLDEVIEHLAVMPSANYIDATFGGGGYTKEILKSSHPQGKVLAIDWSEDAITIGNLKFDSLVNSVLKTRSSSLGGGSEARSYKESPPSSGPRSVSRELDRLTLVQGNFAKIKEIAHSHNFKKVSGVVFDLGLSSDLLEVSGRGFSFERDEPLLMSYSDSQKTAREVVNSWPESELVRIFKEYGEEKQAKKIASAIVDSRKKNKIRTTTGLREVIESSVGSSFKTLARVFQALRIEVNSELENLTNGLNGAWELLTGDGRLVVVSYHSLEDRIVKNFFRDKKNEKIGAVLTKKPVRPSEDEIKQNSRARSAKLRAVIKNK